MLVQAHNKLFVALYVMYKAGVVGSLCLDKMLVELHSFCQDDCFCPSVIDIWWGLAEDFIKYSKVLIHGSCARCIFGRLH